MRIRAALIALAGALMARAPMAAHPLRVAAASDLQTVLPAIAERFEKSTGAKVALTFGSSGNFFTQIQNGAPFDVFLSADIDYPRKLEQAGLAERGSLHEYAEGRLVLWTRTDSAIDVTRGLPVLVEAKVRKIAIANPAHAPYGRAAVAALRHEGLYERVQSKFVLGENISQAAQFAQSGNAEVGLLALSLALAPALTTTGVHVVIPERSYPPIEQAGIVVAASTQKPLARQFLDTFSHPEVMRLLQAYGFALPHAARR